MLALALPARPQGRRKAHEGSQRVSFLHRYEPIEYCHPDLVGTRLLHWDFSGEIFG